MNKYIVDSYKRIKKVIEVNLGEYNTRIYEDYVIYILSNRDKNKYSFKEAMERANISTHRKTIMFISKKKSNSVSTDYKKITNETDDVLNEYFHKSAETIFSCRSYILMFSSDELAYDIFTKQLFLDEVEIYNYFCLYAPSYTKKGLKNLAAQIRKEIKEREKELEEIQKLLK